MSIKRAAILGAVDGIITSFAIIASAYASETELRYVTAIGIASLVSDATSMGIGEYLSSTAEATNNSKILETVKVSLNTNKSSLLNEVSDILKLKNVKNSKKVANYISDSPETLALLKGYQKLDYSPIILGISCFTSFLIFGSIPLMFYILLNSSFVGSIVSSLVSLSILGILEFKKRKFFLVEVLALGTICGTIAYYVGYLVDIIE